VIEEKKDIFKDEEDREILIDSILELEKQFYFEKV
jgi:hypothetical protein